jgi:hypothetical protein
MLLRQGDHVLFFGDSITDAGRREKHNHNEHLGGSYVALVASAPPARHLSSVACTRPAAV